MVPEPHMSPTLSTFRLRRRTPGSFVLVPYPQIGRSIRCQGQLEAAAATILAACPDVINILEQPMQIWYAWREIEERLQIQLLTGPPSTTARRTCAYRCSYIVPDFRVEMSTGSKYLVEVKPSDKLDKPIVKRKLAVGRLYAERQGWVFFLVTEQNLLRGPLLQNVRYLNRYRQVLVSPEALARVEQTIVRSETPLGRIASASDEPSQAIHSAALYLVANGRLCIDPLSHPINEQTMVYPGGTISWDPFASVWALSGCSTAGSTE